MATNEILQFAPTVTGANLLTQAEYAGDEQRLIGNQPGIARSALVNKALRQCSTMAAGLAQYLANKQDTNVTDSLTPAAIASMLNAVISASGGGGGGGGTPSGDFWTQLAPYFADAREVQALTVLNRMIAPGHLKYAYASVVSAASGYVRLPNTIMLQWGAVNGSAGTIRFATAFPVGCFVVCAGGYTGAAQGNQLPTVVTNGYTATGFNYEIRQGTTPITGSFRYLALGA